MYKNTVHSSVKCSQHGRMRNAYTVFWLENLKGRDHLEDLGVDGKIILEWILRK
jgi:hypothetical protein